MIQYSNFDRVMEARDHLKNGASSKSHMSRRNFLEILTKPVVMAFVFSVFALTGCSKDEAFNNDDAGGLWLKMGDNSVVSTSDIDFYDVSTHMIYLKKELPYLDKVFYGGTMSVYVDDVKIYDCSFHPLNVGSLPVGAYISNPHLHEKDIIRISFQPYSDIEDQRSDERIISALKKHHQYHAGLHCKIQSVQVLNGKVVLNFELSNPDTFDYRANASKF